MTEPYLIAHVVRGSPAFDIAIRCDAVGTESDPGPWWIIPTSGHRAYPFAEWSLCEIELSGCPTTYVIDLMPSEVPEGTPDHYSINDRVLAKALDEDRDLALEAAPKGTGRTGLAEALGLVPKPIKIRRR